MVWRASCAAYAALFAELVAGPTTVQEMIAVTGMHENTVRKFVKAMYNIQALETVGKDIAANGRKIRKVHALVGWNYKKRLTKRKAVL